MSNARMITAVIAAAGMVCTAPLVAGRQSAPAQPYRQPSPSPNRVQDAAPVSVQRALLDRYCVTCHNDRLKTAGLTLAALDVGRPADHREIWEKVVRKLRSAAMPPVGMP